MGTGWSIHSADGRQQAVFEILPTDAPIAGLSSVRISLHGDFWNRLQMEAKSPDPDVIRDWSVSLDQVLLAKDSIRSLIEHLDHWIETQDAFSVVLSKNLWPKVILAVSQRSELISSTLKPILSLSYSTAGFQGEWLLPVDHSCLETFREELRVAVGQY